MSTKRTNGYQNHQKERRQETEASPRAAETYTAGTEADAGATHQVLSLARRPRETMKFAKLLAVAPDESKFWQTTEALRRFTTSPACIGRCAVRPRWPLE